MSAIASSMAPSQLNPGNFSDLEQKTLALGRSLFAESQNHFFQSEFWSNKFVQLATSDLQVKTQLFRFVDVAPVLRSFEQKKEHLLEYLASSPQSESWPRTL